MYRIIRKMYRIIMLLIMISILISPVIAIDNQYIKKNTTYRSFVDQYRGFYRVYSVYNMTLGRSVYYQNNTLNISKGDTIVWINDAVPDARLTIVSKDNLWDWHSGTLFWSYKEFAYTFNKSGIYEVYVKEHPNFRQKIIIGPVELNSTSKNVNNNINNTNSTSKNVTKINKINNTNSTSKNVTKINKINNTKLNLIKTNSVNTIIKQDFVLNESNMVPISISLSDDIKSRIDTTIIFTIVLLSVYVLSGRIKDN